jgi:hypothetical protein
MLLMQRGVLSRTKVLTLLKTHAIIEMHLHLVAHHWRFSFAGMYPSHDHLTFVKMSKRGSPNIRPPHFGMNRNVSDAGSLCRDFSRGKNSAN